jgi:hypothetical protein
MIAVTPAMEGAKASPRIVVTSKPLELHGQRTKLRAAVTPGGVGAWGVGPRSQTLNADD